jgi:hypothetical protein
MAVERLRWNQTGVKNIIFKRYQLLKALWDPKTWFLFFFGLSTQVVNGSVSNFGTVIIKGFDTPVSSPLSFKSLMKRSSYSLLSPRCIFNAVSLARKDALSQRSMVVPALAGVAGIHALPPCKSHARLACYYVSSN